MCRALHFEITKCNFLPYEQRVLIVSYRTTEPQGAPYGPDLVLTTECWSDATTFLPTQNGATEGETKLWSYHLKPKSKGAFTLGC